MADPDAREGSLFYPYAHLVNSNRVPELENSWPFWHRLPRVERSWLNLADQGSR
jgi:hypothetical protein